MNKLDITFIAHGNANIGMGHIMRSLSLAAAFRNRGHRVSFFSMHKQGVDFIDNMGFRVTQIPGANDIPESLPFFYGKEEDLEYEIQYLADKIGKKDVVIVDSYNVSSLYFEKLKDFTKYLIYIDDVNAFTYPVDMIVNGTASAFSMGYMNNQTAALLLGMEYNLLRKEFQFIPPKVFRKEVKNILITTGNSDPYHITEWLIKGLIGESEFSKLEYHVIIGGGFNGDIWLNRGIVTNKQVYLYDKPSNMGEIMLKCDMAITAGGSTIYELAACGVPAIAFAYADNQVPQLSELNSKGVLQFLGIYSELNMDILKGKIRYFRINEFERKKIGYRLQTLIDGKGADRVVQKIEQLCCVRS